MAIEKLEKWKEAGKLAHNALHYGKELIQYAESYAKKKKFIEIIITARLSALDFYSKFGYHATGKKFIDVTVKSIKMIKILNHD